MSSVVISSRSIFNQKVTNIEQNKVLLPFNVSKNQIEKLKDLLSKIKVTFFTEQDKLNISNLTYNDINIKAGNRQLGNCRFTLSKTYVVTMKQGFVNKVKSFYNRLVEYKMPERPVFNIGKETNLQEALAEATTEIDLSTINASLNNNIQQNNEVTEQPNQVLANSPFGETVIENPVNLNNVSQEIASVPNVEQTLPGSNNINQVSETQVQTQENLNSQVQNQQNLANSSNQEILNQSSTEIEQPKKHVKKLKGNILVVPIIVIWLGLVFYGTLKLVTNILT